MNIYYFGFVLYVFVRSFLNKKYLSFNKNKYQIRAISFW